MKKRLLSLLLCLVAVLTLLPLPALADGGHSPTASAAETSPPAIIPATRT